MPDAEKDALTDEQRRIIAATRQTLRDLADDWPADGLTLAEARAFILDAPLALAPDRVTPPGR